MSARIYRRKKFKPKKLIKRLALLAILAGLVWGLFLAGRGVYRLATSLFGSEGYLKVATAEEVRNDTGIDAEGVVLRQETVILADKPGQANLLVAEGVDVEAGQRVVELVDKSLLLTIEEELSKLDRQGSTADSSQGDRLMQLDEKLLSSQSNMLSLLDDYRQALHDHRVVDYRTLHNGINNAAKEISKLQQDRVILQQSQNSTEERRAELISRRDQAIVPVFSPASGRISFHVDGLEQVANLGSLQPSLFDQLKQTDTSDFHVTSDVSVSAGQPVFKVTTGKETYLLVSLPEGALTVIESWDEKAVRVDDKDVSFDLPVALVSNPNLGENQCLLQINPPEGTLLPRFMNLKLHTKGEVLCRIPKMALIGEESAPQVLLLEESVVRAQSVTVLQADKTSVMVTGLTPGVTIIKNPAGLSDGMDVSSRLRK